jgi:hypothetical protein
MPDTATEAPGQTEALQEPPTVGSAEWYDGQAAQTRALVAGLPLGSKERAELETRAEWEEQRALDKRGLLPSPEPAAANGTVTAISAPAIEITSATAVPYLERRTAWFDIADYPGRQIQLWVNLPQRVLNDLASGERPRIEPVLRRVVLAHRVFLDGEDRGPWLDFDRQPLPPPSEAAFWDEIPTEMAVGIIRRLLDALAQAPNFHLGTSNG